MHGNGTKTLGQHSNLPQHTVTVAKGPTQKVIKIFQSMKPIEEMDKNKIKPSHQSNLRNTTFLLIFTLIMYIAF